MSIEQRLDEDLKQGMRSKDAARMGCVRQVRSKMQETVNAKDFSGTVDDALYQKVIASYVKQLRRGIEELGEGSGRAQELRDKYQAEIDYLGQFLPKLLDEGATGALVQEALVSSGVTDAKQAGRVVGGIMKTHKGEVDAAVVRRLVDEALGG